jgi:radical SAM superfamily enzyme YgiQ (UPF0313 family)
MMARHHFVLITQESSYPQMGGLYLASALDTVGIETHIIPSGASCETLDKLVSRYDPIAVGCSVMTAPEIVDFVRHSVHVQRTYNLEKCVLPVIWGGMHPTIVTAQTLRESYIDYVVSGEAEVTLPRMLKGIIDGSSYPTSKLVMVETPSDLDLLRPQWERIELGRYLFPEAHSVHAEVEFRREHIFYYLLTSRGCTYKCNFCWEVARTAALRAEGGDRDLTWRSHSTAWIESQLDYLQVRLASEGLSMDGVGLWDDMIFGRGRDEHTARARRVFEIMRDRNLGFLLEARANQLISTTDRWNGSGVTREADLYRYLKETGCMQVFVGTESGSQETLNLIQKGTKIVDYWRLVEMSRDVGLPLRFSMIVGFPQETDRSINETLDSIERLGDEPYISVSGPKLFTPYPGTPQYQMALDAGMTPPATTLDWARLNRYADFRGLFPWLRRQCTEVTLRRIDGFFAKVSAEKKHQPSEETILNLVRGH